MESKLKIAIAFLACFFVLTPIASDAALIVRDTVYLKSGRILRGTVTEGASEKSGDFILLTTESGAVYKLDKGDIVKSILKREKVDDQYEARLRHVRNIATDHIELAKWCERQERGRTRFKEQIRWHYQNVVRLDPDHAKARKALEHMRLPNGAWVAESEFKARQGYVKDRRRGYVAELIKQVNRDDDAYEAQAGAGRKEFNRWLKVAKRGNLQPALLAQICTPQTLDVIYQSAIDVQFNVEACRVHLDAIATVRSRNAYQKLAHFAIEATQRDVREHAISLLQSADDKVLAVIVLTDGLRFSNRWHVLNAAFAIGEVASSDEYSRDFAIVPLINALVTRHEEKIAGALEPGRMNPVFGNGGTGLQMGGGPQTQVKNYQNQASLDALRRIVEADFGFNEQAWNNWYIENYTLSDHQVRSD